MTVSSRSALPAPLGAALRESHLPSLEGLRALAVLLVVLGHFGLAINGGLGVTMFFVISGFLITWLLLKEEAKWGGVSLRLFYLRRSLRIFPAFYALWFLVTIVLGVMKGKAVVWPHAIAAFFYVGNYYQAVTGQWGTPLFHTWSLAIEEQFYLLWPAAFTLLRSNEARLRFLLFAVPCVWIYRLSLVQLGVREGYIYAALDTRADHLLTGCALAVLLYLGKGSAVWSVLLRWRGNIVLTVALMGLSAAVTTWWGLGYRNTAGFIIDPLLTAAFLVQGLAFRSAWLNWSPVRYVGRISYSVYLYHMLAIAAAERIFAGFPVPVRLAGAMGVVITAASVSYYVIEKPFLVLKDRLGQRRVLATNMQ